MKLSSFLENGEIAESLSLPLTQKTLSPTSVG